MSASLRNQILEEIAPLFLTKQEALRCFETIHGWKEAIDNCDLDSPRLILLSLGNLSDKMSFIVVCLVVPSGICAPQVCVPSSLRTRSLLDYVQLVSSKKPSSDIDLILNQLKTNRAAFFSPPKPVLSSLTRRFAEGDEKGSQGMGFETVVRQITMLAWMCGADGVILDIWVGGTSFIRDLQEARSLVDSLSRRCRRLKIRTSFILTHHCPVLGKAVGSRLELEEVVNVLDGRGPLDVLKIAVEFGSEMLILGHKAANKIEAKRILKHNLKSGLALNTLEKILAVQTGDSDFVQKNVLPQKGQKSIKVCSKRSGFLVDLDRDKFFALQSDLGLRGKREKSVIHPTNGLIFRKKRGDWVDKGDLLAQVFGLADEAPRLRRDINSLILLQPDPPAFQPLILDRIRDKDSF